MAAVLQGAYLELADLLGLRARQPPAGRPPPLQRGLDSGLRLSRQRGRGVDFAEVRGYQPGDDVRSIDWRVTARKNTPHTKVFREERERPTFIVVDQTQSMFFGSQRRLKSVAAAELGGLAFWHALHNNDRVGGLILHNDGATLQRPRRSSRHAVRFLADLAEHNQRLDRNGRMPERAALDQALQQIRRVARRGHRILFISDFLPEGDFWLAQLSALAARNELLVVQVYDPLETALPDRGNYTVTDGVERWRFDSAERNLRAAYQARFSERQRALSKEAYRRGIRWLSCATSDATLHVQRWF